MTESLPSKDRAETGGPQATPLAGHFDSPRQQYDSAKLGMWIFLLTEVLFFSSLTMALAVRAAQRDRRGALAGLVGITILCGLAFTGVKFIEYKQKWDHNMVPGQARIEHWSSGQRTPLPPKKFQPDVQYVKERLEHAGHDDLDEEELTQRIDNLRSFMGIYFALTGLHALFVAMSVATVKAALVVLYFMHLRYDNAFYAFVFLAGVAFFGLFLSMIMFDSVEYHPEVEAWQEINR